MKMQKQIALLGIVCLAWGLGPGCTTTQTPSDDTSTGLSRIPEDVLEPMRAMGKALTSATAFQFTVQGSMDEAIESGQLVQITRQSTIAVQRPDRMHLDISGDDVTWEIGYDGKAMTVLDKDANESTSVDAPPTLDELLDFAITEHGLTIPLSDLLYSDAQGTLLENVQAARHLGLHDVGEHKCHHLAFRQEVIDWQLWIDSEGPPVPRKLVITYKDEPGLPQYVSILSDWDLAASFGDTAFTVKLPAGVQSMPMAEFLGMTVEEEGDNDNQ